MNVLKKTCEGIDNLKREHAEYRESANQLSRDKRALTQSVAEK